MTTFQREALLETLEQLRPAIGVPTLTPELAHVWFDGKNVYAFDSVMGIRRKLETDLNCGVPGKALLDLIRTSSLKEVTLTEEKDHVLLAMGRSRPKLAKLPGKRKVWPFPKLLPKAKGLKLGDGLFDAFTRLNLVKLTRQTMTMHKGIMVEVSHEEIRCAATDTISIGQQTVETRSVSMPRFLIQWPLVVAICTLLEGQKDPRLWLLDDCIIAGRPGTMLACAIENLKDTPSPQKIVETKFANKLAPIPKGFRTAMERACILAGDKDPLVTLRHEGGVLRVSGKWPLGALNEQLDTKGKGGTLKLRADLIVRALQLCDEYHIGDYLSLAGDDGRFQYILTSKTEE